MFTTPCFIKKNTPELRKKLEELGYTYNGRDTESWGASALFVLMGNIMKFILLNHQDTI